MHHKQKIQIAILLVSIVLQPVLALAQDDIRAEFNPSLIIPDNAFNDIQTFGSADGIQKFLESKGSPLANTTPEFLAQLDEPNDPTFKQTLGDPSYQAGHVRSAAELIWDASQASGLNPQVILVTLQKEQGLVTGGNNTTPDRIKRALNFAMGFACPDYGSCGQLFSGFYYQLFGNIDTESNRYLGAAKSLMKSFSTPNGRGPLINGSITGVGDTILLNNTLGGFNGVQPQQTVTLTNLATTALYRYTPHVFNGNYNFWRYFTSWFRYPNGTLLRMSGDDTLYIVENGERQRVLSFVVQARGLNLSGIIAASPTEMQNYPVGILYGPADATIISVDGRTYVFYDNIKHPVSVFVLAQRKLDAANAITVASTDADQFTNGPQLTPGDGTIIKGTTYPTAYIVQNGVLKQFGDFTFKQLQAAKKMQTIPDDEIASYPKQGYVIPLDGTLMKSKTGTLAYLVSSGQKLPMTTALFKNLGFSKNKVVTLSDEELGSFVTGPTPTPKDKTYFKTAESGELYFFKDGARHKILAFVAKQRHITADYTFDDLLVDEWPNGIAVPPLNNTLVKSADDTTVYVVLNGQLRPLTPAVFKNRGYNMKNVKTLPASDIEILPQDGFAPPRELSYFTTMTSGDLYLFKNGEKHKISSFVAKQRKITPDYTFNDSAVADWPGGTPIMPVNNSIVKGDASSTIYVVSASKLRALSAKALAGRYATQAKKVKTLPQAEINSYPKGSVIAK